MSVCFQDIDILTSLAPDRSVFNAIFSYDVKQNFDNILFAFKSVIEKKLIVILMFINTSRKLPCIKVTPDLHLTHSKNGGNLGLVLKMKNIACISILLTKHVKYTYLYLFKFVLYSIVAFKAN